MCRRSFYVVLDTLVTPSEYLSEQLDLTCLLDVCFLELSACSDHKKRARGLWSFREMQQIKWGTEWT